MSDVRDELMRVLDMAGCDTFATYADAVMERFDVTPKSAISDEMLGGYATSASLIGTDNNDAGKRLRKYLDEAGLEIVRKGAGGEE